MSKLSIKMLLIARLPCLRLWSCAADAAVSQSPRVSPCRRVRDPVGWLAVSITMPAALSFLDGD